MHAETGRAVTASLSSGDGSAFAACDGQVLLDIQVPGRLGDSEGKLVNSQLLLRKANHDR